MSAGDSLIRFEMDRLIAYDDDSLIEELRRVAATVPDGPLSQAVYDRHALAHSSTVRRRFGGWREALERAGLADRYGGPTVISRRMREQRGRAASAEEVVTELRRIAGIVSRTTITRADLTAHGELSERTVLSRFGSWKAALEAAGLHLSRMGRRYTEAEYFENLLIVWTHHGRPPTYAEMDRRPSQISKGAYASRFGTWGRAKQAFVAYVNADLDAIADESRTTEVVGPTTTAPRTRVEDQRNVPIGLRYQVLRRDRFRCTACGRSPATDAGCVLHVDHVVAFARGGKTRLDNLRSLCAECNVGKGVGNA